VICDPCGAAMDLVRSCYHDRMMGLAADGSTVRVRWYFTDQDFLPFSTVFVSRAWYDEQPAEPNNGPGPVRNRGRWADGSGLPIPCCDTPRGDHNAFLGLTGGPIFRSCGWTDRAGHLQVRLIFRSTVRSPRKYAGRFQLNLRWRSNVIPRPRYAGRFQLKLSWRSTIISPRYYPGRFKVDLSWRSNVVSIVPYPGRFRMAELFRSATFPGAKYPGHFQQNLGMRATVFTTHYYAGRFTQALSFRSTVVPTNPLINYGNCSSTYTFWNFAASGFSGFCATLNGSFDLAFNSGSQQFESTAHNTDGSIKWVLIYQGFPSDEWLLVGYVSAGVIEWEGIIAQASYNCLASNTFPWNGSSSCPGSVPSSITVSPS
jgi:hypothetical protein